MSNIVGLLDTSTGTTYDSLVPPADGKPEVIVDTAANISDFKCSKKFAYGTNYTKFCELYASVADTISIADFEGLIKKVYVDNHKEEILNLAADHYATQETLNNFQSRLYSELRTDSLAIRKQRRKEKRYINRTIDTTLL